jgi:hypothetical protein
MEKIQVDLYTIPQAACGLNKMTWFDVAALLKSNLEKSFPDQLAFLHVEFMSQEWFADAKAQELLESQLVNFPFVLVNGEIACSEVKVNISRIRKFIQTLNELK